MILMSFNKLKIPAAVGVAQDVPATLRLIPLTITWKLVEKALYKGYISQPRDLAAVEWKRERCLLQCRETLFLNCCTGTQRGGK